MNVGTVTMPSAEPKERAGSLSSSSADASSFQDNEKLGYTDRGGDDEEKLRSPDELEIRDDDDEDGDDDREKLLQQEAEREQQPPQPPKNALVTAFLWMAINTLATIGIVRC